MRRKVVRILRRLVRWLEKEAPEELAEELDRQRSAGSRGDASDFPHTTPTPRS